MIKKHENLITIHTHPGSMPPSIADFNSNYKNNYRLGVVACHDGKVFGYTANETTSDMLYNLYINEYISSGKNAYESQILALEQLKKTGVLNFWEV